MFLEKNPITRPLYRRLLSLNDRVSGIGFASMKRVKQANIHNCGPAVLVELFSFLGKDISQAAVVKTLRAQKKIKLYGLNIKELAKATKTLSEGELIFWKKQGAKISDIDLIVNKYKHPVAVEWQGVFYEHSDGEDGHYCVVTNIDKQTGYLRLADSFYAYFGVDRRFKIKFFEKRWWDVNEIKVSGTTRRRQLTDNKVMFVIAPKGESWPKKLGMTKAP